MRYAYQVLSVVLCLFVLLAVNISLNSGDSWLAKIGNGLAFSEISRLALFAMVGLLLVFLDRPVVKSWKDFLPLKIANWGMMAATVVVFGYIFVQSDAKFSTLWVNGDLLGDRAGNEAWFDFVIGGIGIGLILEGTRRAIGWTLPILCCLFAAYAMFGPSMPDWCFPHAGKSWEQFVGTTFLQGGVFGIALKVMFTYVFLFVLFGTLLEQTGATAYVINFAKRLFRNSTGGPAKIAVLSSGLMGSLSGSAVANTAATGTFTIPLMKSSGFDADTAGGVEAAASSGGALAPPVMGAGAYMMLEMIQPSVTYSQIMQAALIPAVLYYFALMLTVHFHAKRVQLKVEAGSGKASDDGVEAEGSELSAAGKNGEKVEGLKEQTSAQIGKPVARDTAVPSKTEASDLETQFDNVSVYQGVLFFGSFVVLIVALLKGFTPFRAVSVSLAVMLVASFLHGSTRLNPTKLLAACTGAAKGGMALVVAAACVGIILGVVSVTPLSSALPMRIQSYAGDSAILALLMLMFSTIILGMGLPSAVCYLLMANLVGEVLSTLGAPPLAAHLFIFYFGMMSMVTPPVALAAYAAAAISGGNVLKTAFEAFRFSLVGFALPFAFVFKPELLMLTVDNQPAGWLAIVVTVACTVMATTGMAVAVAGYFVRQIGFLQRAMLLVLSLIVFFTRNSDMEWWVQIGAVGLIVAWLLFAIVRGRDSRDQKLVPC